MGSRRVRRTLTLIAARAAWSGATEAFVPDTESGELPLAGATGTDLTLANEAWHFAAECMKGLRSIGWSPNVELISPIVCAAAGVVGHQRDALALLGEAAERRPEYTELQADLELLAIGAGDPETALAANQRQPDCQDVLVRRTATLFQLRRFADCLSWALAVARSSETPVRQTPMALATGYAAAHRIGRLMDAGELREKLSCKPDWGEYLRFAEFARLGSLQPSGDGPLAVLREGLAEYPGSWLLASNLYSNLRVSDEAQAAEAVRLAKQLRQRALPTVEESRQLVAALTTLKRWNEAAAEAKSAQERFGLDERLLAMGAVAEEMVGRTASALSMLERAMAVGTDRISVVHNYMGLALRLGRMGAVRAAIDKLLGLVTDRAERLELMRLSTLIHVQENRPLDALAAVSGVGHLVDRSVEQEEGMYLNLVMVTSLSGPPVDDAQKLDFAERVDAFCAKWPQSTLFRRVEVPANGITPLDDLHKLLDPLVGDSRARLREFELRERRANRGEVAIPFIVRPGYVLHYIGNPFHLWEVAKRSKPSDLQFHLAIAHVDTEPKSQNPRRDTPLLDLTALLVLDSLDLFDKLFLIFDRIAIPQLTVTFVSQQASSFLGGGAGSGTAKSILARINHWLHRIDQPASSDRRATRAVAAGPVLVDYVKLAEQRSWLTYSDDSIVRRMLHADAPNAPVCTTLDVLDLLDLGEIMTAAQVAGVLAHLANWNVVISVPDRTLIASLVGALPEDFKGDASRRVEQFQRHSPFTTLSRAVWNPGKNASDLVVHMGQLLQSMLQNPESDGDSVAAVLASWFIRVRMLQDPGVLAWKLACYPVVLALNRLPDSFSGRLVNVLQRAIAATVSEQHMSVAIEAQVANELGSISASLAKRDSSIGGALLRKLLIAMPPGTANGDHCMEGYIRELKADNRERQTD
jgi:hypothetical protein